MATIDIDVEDLDLDDLMNGVINKLDYYGKLSEKEKSIAKKLQDQLARSTNYLSPVNSSNLADQMKVEYLLEIKDQYTESDLRLAIGYWIFNGKPTTY